MSTHRSALICSGVCSPVVPVPRYRGLDRGWLIARPFEPDDSILGGSPPPSTSQRDGIRCLQIATGQWCPPDQATWFPVRSAATSYANDLTRPDHDQVEIVFLTKVPGG
ncbi:hypothetical protein NHH03_14300 [Stieleria sp. TO1_6]|uniref:hypothetical protein n=1 Tax=Stieleria tagensis TaxID=2956795 RepID=UPI00209AA707|nr:hypothetical protein [Stieleria tagensis]MCO8122916.1 hypothetical protein [Stieleria tagensis]